MLDDRLEFPRGFAAHAAPLGLRESGDDFAVVFSRTPASSSGVFTRSLFAGPSVTLSRGRAKSGRARAIAVVAKNANVANGDQGLRDAIELSNLVGAGTGVDPEEIVVASTGVIGRPYPMALIRSGLATLCSAPFESGPTDVAKAMMTTDTVLKVSEQTVGNARVVGVAKGVGMIEPDMATMLAFVFTDAAAEPALLDRLWRRAVDETFNCLSVDTDTSTSDTAVVLANGAAGPVSEAKLGVALREACRDLTIQLARDGEGATKLITVTASGAADGSQARRVAKSVVNSPLVKAAVHGADPNWGRVAMAIGKCYDEPGIDPDRVAIYFGDLQAYPARPGPQGLAALATVMKADHVDITVELANGEASATVYGCDLSAEYVHINADYTT